MTEEQNTNQAGLMAKGEAELRKIRENCGKWAVDEDAANLREYLVRSGLSLKDLGSSENELASCIKMGFTSSARNWLKVARENVASQDVTFCVGQIRVRLAQVNLSPNDIGSSEEELNKLLVPRKRS